jgi:hypothetical protein
MIFFWQRRAAVREARFKALAEIVISHDKMLISLASAIINQNEFLWTLKPESEENLSGAAYAAHLADQQAAYSRDAERRAESLRKFLEL